ncbi:MULTISPECIES: Sec-independent protein translocase protein TatB [unclassified Luteibacter]|uniref:Sec-independent protein translocase protein TatB n=1 Tax=unclassified Luteibacter TaxID=2620188 RepID=UPI0008C76697|nr:MULTISPECIES: Sec-independent protein translocase protein TatB [unclassified Luteibacter]MDR6937201.1 sec-independent protein translocase protein TatB [Luteibacter sp. 3190]SEO43812.1 sec-independent protein translocase protein TatB [Luteibacter sp. UNC138MFCol5.1]SEW12898.1 sec-independent protein translocase protein TatB [Luteibacter sp. 329MFSha]
MIDISIGKLLLLAVVALIVLGPERLPHAARTAGALLRRVRNGWDSVRAEVEREIHAEEIKRTLRETADNARATHDSVRKDFRDAGEGFRDAGARLREAGDSMRDTITETQAARVEPRDPDPAVDMLPLNRDGKAPSGTEPHDRT